jgi:hypothetical protein
MSDEPKSKAPLVFLAIVLLVCGLAAAWLIVKMRHEKAHKQAPHTQSSTSIPSTRPTASLYTLRMAARMIPEWHHQAAGLIAWGDGKEQTLSSIPQKTTHTYAAEGEYTISLWCVDNLGRLPVCRPWPG